MQSGTRIRISAYTADGEVLQVIGTHDTLRDVDCYIDVAEDGVSRCMPSQGTVYYRDENCTEPLILVPSSPADCAAPQPSSAYVSYKSQRPCPVPVVHVVKPGAALDPPSNVYAFSLGSCQQQPFSASQGTLHDAIPSPPSDWVGFTSTVKTITPELGIVQWSGADGTRTTAIDLTGTGVMRLLANNAACDPVGDYAGAPNAAIVYRCIPSNRVSLAINAFYSDTACTDVVAIAPTCQPPDLLAEPVSAPPGGCGEGTSNFFAVGDVIPNSSVSTNALGPCRPAESILGGFTSYLAGAQVDPATFPVLQEAPSGRGRLQPWVWQVDGISTGVLDNGELADAATGAQAEITTTFTDGIARGTVSLEVFTEAFYSDDVCQHPVYARQRESSAPCVQDPMPRWLAFEPDGQTTPPGFCGTPRLEPSVRPVGALHSGPVYTTISNYTVDGTDACSVFMPSRSAFTYDFYDLDDPVPASSVFAEIKTTDL